MTGSEQYDDMLNLDDGVKIADNLVKYGFSSKIDDFLQQLCPVTAVNDDVAADLPTREYILKKIIDAVVVARKPLADEDKSRLFTYIENALHLNMNPLSIGIDDKALAALIIENTQNPSAAQHNAQVLQLAQKLQENSAFFELTASKYVSFDSSQIPVLAGQCLDLAEVQKAPKGVLYALTLVNFEQVNIAMDILSALAQKGCATDMASFIHRLLPYVEGDDVDELLKLLQQNLQQQDKIFEQQALYDYSARVYLQAARSFAEGGYYMQSEALVNFLLQNQRLEGFDDEVKQVELFIEENKQRQLESERQEAFLQAKVEAIKTAIAEAEIKAQQEEAEQNMVLEAEATPVEPVNESMVVNEEPNLMDSMYATPEPAVEESAPVGMVVNEEPNLMDSMYAAPEPTVEENAPMGEGMVAGETPNLMDSMYAAPEPAVEESAPVGMVVNEEPNLMDMMYAAPEQTVEENAPMSEGMVAGEEPNLMDMMYAAPEQMTEETAPVNEEPIVTEEAPVTAEDVTLKSEETVAPEAVVPEAVPTSEEVAVTETAQTTEAVAVAEAPAEPQPARGGRRFLRGALKSILSREKLDGVGDTVLGIKDKIIKNNKIELNAENLDKGIEMIKDVTSSALKIAGEQTAKVKQKVEDIVKNEEETPTVEAGGENPTVSSEAVAAEPTISKPMTEPAVEATPKPAAPAAPKKVVSTFYEVPFWERENAEELALREQALMQPEPAVENEMPEPASEQFEPQNEFNNYAEEQESAPLDDIAMNEQPVEETFNASQEAVTEETAEADKDADKAAEKKPNFDDIDINSVSNYSSLDDFGYQLDEDLDAPK